VALGLFYLAMKNIIFLAGGDVIGADLIEVDR